MIKAPHILLLAEYGSSGGTRTYFKQLLALYAEKHARVTVLRTYENKDDEINQICALYNFKYINASSVVGEKYLFKGRLPFRHLYEKRLFRNFIIKNNPDVVVASVGTPELFLGAISNAAKAIYILHTYPNVENNYLKRSIKNLFFKFIISPNTKVITVSEFSKKRILLAWGIAHKSSDVEVVYNTMGDIVHKKRSHTLNELNVLTVGHVVAYKNPDVWINMAILLKESMPLSDLKFTWVGDGDLLETCRTKIKNLGADSWIKFVGHDSEIAKYYDQCDIYVQPSLIENLGMSVLDAMRYGIPCIVANTGGLTETIRDGETGWIVDANNPGAMAEKIGLLKTPALREKMGARAKKLYHEKFKNTKWKEQIWYHHQNDTNIV